MKKNKEENFVMLVKKKNGRIIKNEQYTVDEFLEKIIPNVGLNLDKKLNSDMSLFTRLFNFKNYINIINKRLEKTVNECEVDINNKILNTSKLNIIFLIEKDNFGKKVKKSTKN